MALHFRGGRMDAQVFEGQLEALAVGEADFEQPRFERSLISVGVRSGIGGEVYRRRKNRRRRFFPIN